jgi:hypothetical protein
LSNAETAAANDQDLLDIDEVLSIIDGTAFKICFWAGGFLD